MVAAGQLESLSKYKYSPLTTCDGLVGSVKNNLKKIFLKSLGLGGVFLL